ncbi:MAG: ATP-binding protein [Saprospiraceae bacterium]|nr:ATP-binding protein [Saprospiraceae bacterium]MDW8228428.1 ATP-binding protein [Saprospiraceae bacterium]
MIKRLLESKIRERLFKGKAIILTGPRQTGKTTLLKQIFDGMRDVLWLNGDDIETRILLEEVSTSKWSRIIKSAKVVVVDEAQRIRDIGIKLKLVTDQFPAVQLVASGSSTLELANQINEPLTGRKWHYQLFPLSYEEMEAHHGFVEENRRLSDRLVYGSYPEVVSHPDEARDILSQLADSFLYKDILMWERIKKPEKLMKLLQALAFQLGNEVSYHELGQITDLDNQTIENYITLLEQTFILFRLPPLSRNLRKELKTKRKIYFYDNGIRNALIAQYQPPELRQDMGALWENWFISERKKWLHYHSIYANTYFWRTQDQQEIDYVEERDGFMWAYEIKWGTKAKAHFSKTFRDAYPQHHTQVVHRDNFFEFLAH